MGGLFKCKIQNAKLRVCDTIIIMIVICRNAAAFRKSRYYRLLAKLFFVNTILHYIHSKDYSRIFKENSIPNEIFGIETVYFYTVSTNYNRYWIFGVEGEDRLAPFKTETPKRLEKICF